MAESGESETLEFKKSTASLSRAGEALCAFLNGRSGRVLIGVTAKGKVVGQQVTDSTLRDVASMLERLEPPGRIGIERVILGCGREVILLEAPAGPGRIPFAFCGRAYHRVGTTTSLIPQELYQQLLIERAHHQYRWENRPARSVEVDDLDGEEIMRTVRMGIETGRLPESTGSDLGDILDRLKLRQYGRPLIAGVFFRRGLIEQWGRGTEKIVKLCVDAGHPERNILNIIGRVETIPLREIMSRLENPPSSITVRDDLYQLKQIGFIDSKGHGRSAVWFLR